MPSAGFISARVSTLVNCNPIKTELYRTNRHHNAHTKVGHINGEHACVYAK